MNEMIYYDQITQSLSESLHYGSSTLADIPNLVKQVLEKKMWKKRTVRATGQVAEFKYFADYVTAREPEGLGGSLAQLRALCRDRDDVLELINGELGAPNPNGTNQQVGFSRENPTLEQQGIKGGDNLPYTVALLKGKGHNDLADKLSSGVIGKDEAKRQAGLPIDDRIKSMPIDNPQRAAEIVIEKMPQEVIAELVSLLSDWLKEQA